MGRLDKQRESELQPQRMGFAKSEIEKLGYEIVTENDTQLVFLFKGNKITFFPYSGWHSGKGITDGRGWKNLYKQIKK